MMFFLVWKASNFFQRSEFVHGKCKYVFHIDFINISSQFGWCAAAWQLSISDQKQVYTSYFLDWNCVSVESFPIIVGHLRCPSFSWMILFDTLSSRQRFLGATQSHQHDCQLTPPCIRKANISTYRLMLKSRPDRPTASSPKTAAKYALKWRTTETCLLFYALCNRIVAAYRLEKKNFRAQATARAV